MLLVVGRLRDGVTGRCRRAPGATTDGPVGQPAPQVGVAADIETQLGRHFRTLPQGLFQECVEQGGERAGFGLREFGGREYVADDGADVFDGEHEE